MRRAATCLTLIALAALATEPAHHQQTFAEPYNPAFSGELRVPMDGLQPMPLSELWKAWAVPCDSAVTVSGSSGRAAASTAPTP